jgi:uncharacterized membrane protein
MLKSGGFWHRLITALVAASLAFSPFYFLSFSNALSSEFNHEMLWVTFLNSLDVFAICEAVILGAIFAIAYPVERFLNNESKSAFRNAASYAFIGIIVSTVLFLLTRSLIDSNNFGLAVAFYVSIFGTITAFIGRLIYPTLLKLKRTVLALTALISALVLTAAIVQPVQASSPQADDFYPSTFEGEVVRASWDVNEEDGSAGTNQTMGTGKYNPDQSYNLTYRCRDHDGAQFEAIIRRKADLKTLQVILITCTSTAEDFWPVDLGAKPLDVTLILSPTDPSGNAGGSTNGVNSHPDAWAVLAPVLPN